jgi:hypothetical protein
MKSTAVSTTDRNMAHRAIFGKESDGRDLFVSGFFMDYFEISLIDESTCCYTEVDHI